MKPGKAEDCPLNANHKRQLEFRRERGPVSRRGPRTFLEGPQPAMSFEHLLIFVKREGSYHMEASSMGYAFIPASYLLLTTTQSGAVDVYK